jgi:hypothetical protein
MRIVRLFGAALAILTAGLLLATPAGAQPPAKLTDHITDSTGVLTDSGRAAVGSAIDRLYHARHIQLWVVYVDNFSRFKPENWDNQTRSASAMGDHDALLAVATNTKLYTFTVPPNLLSADELSSLRSRQIEPAVAAKDWSGAAVAAADGLNKSPSSSKRIWLLIAIGVAVVVVVVAVVLLLYRARRRRRLGPLDGQVNIEGRDHSVGRALSTADARVRQISDYVARHRESIGAEAQARLEEAKRHLAAARGRETTNEPEALAYANRTSTLAAQAQTLANADVLAAHRTPRRRGTASTR